MTPSFPIRLPPSSPHSGDTVQGVRGNRICPEAPPRHRAFAGEATPSIHGVAPRCLAARGRCPVMPGPKGRVAMIGAIRGMILAAAAGDRGPVKQGQRGSPPRCPSSRRSTATTPLRSPPSSPRTQRCCLPAATLILRLDAPRQTTSPQAWRKPWRGSTSPTEPGRLSGAGCSCGGRGSPRGCHSARIGEASIHRVGARIEMTVRPTALAPMTAIGGHVRYGIQVPASCLGDHERRRQRPPPRRA